MNISSIKKGLALSLVVSLFLTSCQSSTHKTELLNISDITDGTQHFTERVPYSSWNRGKLTELPKDEGMGFDLRSLDASALELSDQTINLANVTFDTQTIWPQKLPDAFDAASIMELGKDPGLGIRGLHEQGITGKGINIAIIDQALVQDHEEYADRLMTYETIHCSDGGAQMHGPAVTSIAAGKTCGVAPDAKIYYIASTFGTFNNFGGFKEDLTSMADSIERILEINHSLPEEQKIKVISISKGITDAKGAQQALDAIQKAKNEGVFVITTSMDTTYNCALMGLGRELTNDPNNSASYTPGKFWSKYFYDNPTAYENILLVPMDARTYAGWGSATGYEFGASGGLSWSVPWLAGMYALCLQTNPNLDAEKFISICLETSDTAQVEHDGKSYNLSGIINPQKVIEQVEKDIS